MSIVIRFFVAPDAEAAAAVAEGGPDGVFESLTSGNFDVEEALIEWEGIFTGRSFEEVLDDDVPETVVDPDDGEGPLVLAVSRKRPIPTRAGVLTAGLPAHCLPKTACPFRWPLASSKGPPERFARRGR